MENIKVDPNKLSSLLEHVLPKDTVTRIIKLARWLQQDSESENKISVLDAFETEVFWDLINTETLAEAVKMAKGLKQAAIAAFTGNYAFKTDAGLTCVLKPLSISQLPRPKGGGLIPVREAQVVD